MSTNFLILFHAISGASFLCHWIRDGFKILTNRIKWKRCVTFQDCYKWHWEFFVLSTLDYSRETSSHIAKTLNHLSKMSTWWWMERSLLQMTNLSDLWVSYLKSRTSSSHQAFRWYSPGWCAWNLWVRAIKLSCSGIPSPHKLCEIISIYCFKPLCFWILFT